MNEPAATPLDRLIAALARKAVADHLARAADEADQKQHAQRCLCDTNYPSHPTTS